MHEIKITMCQENMAEIWSKHGKQLIDDYEIAVQQI